MIKKAVIDRFEGDKAILLVGDEQRQVVASRASLPRTAKEGSWLAVTIEDDVILSVNVDEDETNKARQRISDKLERLRRGEHI
jgi:hypothetical protein